jgi:hypothetical protein
MHESEMSQGLSPEQMTSIYQPGALVRITQQIPRRTGVYTAQITCRVIRQERQNSGSWYARNPRDKVWLDRLIVRKENGETSILNLDEYTAVEILEGPPTVAGESPLISPAQDASASVP